MNDYKDYFEFEDGSYFAVQTNGTKVYIQQGNIYLSITLDGSNHDEIEKMDKETRKYQNIRIGIFETEYDALAGAEEETWHFIFMKHDQGIKQKPQTSDFWRSAVERDSHIFGFVPDEDKIQ
ncbi:hypothetical protein FACS1894109_02570 [Spirochaetia bacterium]|nr:hypothetical protein FACS1894109_02570 [Spirochaetia bacterium]